MSMLYDRIGIGYDTTRKADPEITRRLYNHLQVYDGGPVLDVACGTGNYTIALHQMGLQMTGVDISETMIRKAREKSSEIRWEIADACKLPYGDNQFSGAICTLAIHHFERLKESLKEIYRVLKPNGRFVIFTALPEQMERYWLVEYFPEMMKKSIEQMPKMQRILDSFENAGFRLVGAETFMIQPNLEDFFLYSGKYRPEIYFCEEVRRGISSFASLADPNEVEIGLARLKEDLNNGEFESRIRNKYNSLLGDYIFVVGEKVGS